MDIHHPNTLPFPHKKPCAAGGFLPTCSLDPCPGILHSLDYILTV